MTVDLEKVLEAANSYASKDPSIDHDYWACVCAEQMPDLIDEIGMLWSENREKDAEIKWLEEETERILISVHQNCSKIAGYRFLLAENEAKIKDLEDQIHEYAAREAEYVTDIGDRDEEIQELETRIAELEAK
jgi:chromosome segregation ATPase